MGSPIAPSHLTLSDLERLNSRSHIFRRLISRKGALGPMLLLNIKSETIYMGSPTVGLNLLLKGQSQSHFEPQYLVKEIG